MNAACYYEGHQVAAPGTCARCGDSFGVPSRASRVFDLMTLGPLFFRVRRHLWRRRRARRDPQLLALAGSLRSAGLNESAEQITGAVGRWR